MEKERGSVSQRVKFRLPLDEEEQIGGLFAFFFFFVFSAVILCFDKTSFLNAFLQDFVSDTTSISELHGVVALFTGIFITVGILCIALDQPTGDEGKTIQDPICGGSVRWHIPEYTGSFWCPIYFFFVFLCCMPLYYVWLCLKFLWLHGVAELCVIIIALFILDKNVAVPIILLYGLFSAFLFTDEDNTSFRFCFLRMLIACSSLVCVSFYK